MEVGDPLCENNGVSSCHSPRSEADVGNPLSNSNSLKNSNVNCHTGLDAGSPSIISNATVIDHAFLHRSVGQALRSVTTPSALKIITNNDK